MTRRSPFQEGEGGVQRGPTTPVPNLPAGGRVPSGPLQQWPCPALAGPDMGQLITALTLGLQIGTPKISTFSGDVAPSKNRGVLQIIEPQGAVYQGPLSRISGQREYHAVSARSSSRHGLLYGPYCRCL